MLNFLPNLPIRHMMKKYAFTIVIVCSLFSISGANDGQNASLTSLEQDVSTLKSKFNDARIEYQKVKSVSRDWDRRNEAEEAFYGTYEAYMNAQMKLFQAKIEDLEKHARRSPAATFSSKAAPFWATLLALIALLMIPMALIFSDLFKSFVGFLVIRRSIGFKPTDRIEVGPTMGDVVHIGPFQTTLLEVKFQDGAERHTDKIIHLPNYLILKEPLHVQSKK